jgi:hypothetical protein
MQFARYHTGDAPRWGVITDETITPAAALEAPVTYERLATPGFTERVAQRLTSTAAEATPLSAVQLCAPVPRPGKIICVGLNYHDHAAEQGKEPPERPLLFTKSPSAVIGPDDAVIRPEAIDQLDYEAELAVVIGRTARAVSAAAATEYIAGYTALNDRWPMASSSAARATTRSRRWGRRSCPPRRSTPVRSRSARPSTASSGRRRRRRS